MNRLNFIKSSLAATCLSLLPNPVKLHTVAKSFIFTNMFLIRNGRAVIEKVKLEIRKILIEKNEFGYMEIETLDPITNKVIILPINPKTMSLLSMNEFSEAHSSNV
jgi:hypothetical protein